MLDVKALPILCLDFDGVIHSYTSGWKGAAVIPDAPVLGSMEFLYHALQRFRVAIYSSRSNQPGGIVAMQDWLDKHFRIEHELLGTAGCRSELSKVQWPREKPPALVTLDDRAITFTGEFPSLDELARFKPWNNKDV